MTESTPADVPPPPPSRGAPGLVPSLPWTPDEAIAFGWKMVKSQPACVGVLFLAALLSNLLPLIGRGIEFAAYLSNARGDEFLRVQLIVLALVLVNIPVSVYFTIGTWRYLIRLARGEPAVLGDLFGPGPFLTMFGAMIVAGIGTLIGLVFCIVPGVILALGLMLYMGLIVDKRLGAIESLTESWRLTSGHKVQIFVLWLFTIGVALAGIIACCVGFVVALPIIQLSYAYLYLKLTGQEVVQVQ